MFYVHVDYEIKKEKKKGKRAKVLIWPYCRIITPVESLSSPPARNKTK